MSDKQVTGKITFIHHEKDRAVIEYMDNERKKTIQADINIHTQKKLKEQKLIKKTHRYLIGDQVSFNIKKTGSNGSIVYATNVQYLYNTALELLLNQAVKENKFLGYIKITDDEYFIKEIESYLFFPLTISPYEIAPTEKNTADPIIFKLENIGNPDKITASLYNHEYIPEFSTAVQHFKKQTPVEAVVEKITAFGVHLNLIGKIQAKLAIDEDISSMIENKSIEVGSRIFVMIKHLSPTKIVVEKGMR